MKQSNSAIIIGAGVGGLGSACLLAKSGWDVTIIEKNEQLGGRVGLLEEKGFRFDSGASWYLMPDVFEHFFELLGEDINKHLELKRLSPSFRVFYKGLYKLRPCTVDVHSNIDIDVETFEALEPGAGDLLRKYLNKTEYEYGIAKDRFMYKNYDSMRDFLTREMLSEGRKLNVLSNMHKEAGKYFKSPYLQKILEFPAMFLGSRPDRTPALFGIMNHAILGQGVYYPMGGMYKVVEALERIARKHNVKFSLNAPVSKIVVEQGKAVGVTLKSSKQLRADIIISNAGLYHTETALLEQKYRTMKESYWKKRVTAPSALLLYLGIKGKLPTLSHHNLLFNPHWKQNFDQILPTPPFQGGSLERGFPSDPSFYVCNPSKSDTSVAPMGHENLFVLVPLASGMSYTTRQLETFSEDVLETIEKEMSIPDLRQRIVYQKLFSVKDFAERFNSYQGSALGLSHTLRQTAIFRPNNISKKVKNLYYVGADTNPGIGIPPALISAELMYKRLVGDNSTGPLRPNQFSG